MEACAVICWKATFTIPDLPFPSSRAQNQGFCSFLAFRTIIFRPLEHKIEVFVRFWGLQPSFSGFSSTKTAFLCAFALRTPSFRAFRAQNRGFCAFLPFETLVFGRFEHKIEVFVRFLPSGPPFSGFSSTKSAFLCAIRLRNPDFPAVRAQKLLSRKPEFDGRW